MDPRNTVFVYFLWWSLPPTTSTWLDDSCTVVQVRLNIACLIKLFTRSYYTCHCSYHPPSLLFKKPTCLESLQRLFASSYDIFCTFKKHFAFFPQLHRHFYESQRHYTVQGTQTHSHLHYNYSVCVCVCVCECVCTCVHVWMCVCVCVCVCVWGWMNPQCEALVCVAQVYHP